MSDLCSAVRKLRKEAGLTQQELANRLGISSRAIANYEADRTPAAMVLWKLGNVASDYNLDDLAKRFSSAHAAAMKNRFEPTNDEERAIVRATLLLARDKSEVPNWPEIMEGLLKGIEALSVASVSGERTKAEPAALDEALVLLRYWATPNAEQKLDEKAKERSARTGETYHQSYAAVLLENPDLYTEYLQQRATAAKGTSFESTMPKGALKKKAGKQ